MADERDAHWSSTQGKNTIARLSLHEVTEQLEALLAKVSEIQETLEYKDPPRRRVESVPDRGMQLVRAEQEKYMRRTRRG